MSEKSFKITKKNIVPVVKHLWIRVVVVSNWAYLVASDVASWVVGDVLVAVDVALVAAFPAHPKTNISFSELQSLTTGHPKKTVHTVC